MTHANLPHTPEAGTPRRLPRVKYKPLSRYGKMISAVRIPKNMLALANGLQRRGHTFREIALVLDMSIEPVKRSLYYDKVNS
jgi:hypothetical protein